MSPLLADAGPPLVDDDELRRWREGGEQAEPQPEVDAPSAELDPDVRWEEAQVRTLLKIQGGALHLVLSGGHPQAWKYTADDLDDIAGPLTRIANRYPLTRAAAAAGDELALAAALGKYGVRSMVQRGQAIAAAELAETEAETFVQSTGRITPDGRIHPTEPAAGHDVWGGSQQ